MSTLDGKAYDRIVWRGFTLNRRTAAALEWVEAQTGLQIHLAQGSYNPGGVKASGTTHAGGGAVDCRVVFYTEKQRVKVLHALRDAGFAAWFRPAVAGLWGAHIHAILIADKEMSSSAASQVQSYLQGRSGLSSNGPDIDKYRPKPQMKFNFKKNCPVPL